MTFGWGELSLPEKPKTITTDAATLAQLTEKAVKDFMLPAIVKVAVREVTDEVLPTVMQVARREAREEVYTLMRSKLRLKVHGAIEAELSEREQK